ncbi:hypothetical protein DH86_00001530 [Scytalidium sp. 3C]|nr:hypothetical protein DH86_00001530 [Scytalidium sp. 3C]
MQRFYCWGPSKPPMYMTANEAVDWNAHLQTPVIYNHHEPLVVNASTIKHVDLNPIKSTPQAVSNEERVLILTPLRDAAFYLPKYFDLLSELTYPHHLIDLGFLVGDSTDDTIAVLSAEVNRIQEGENTTPFNSVLIIEKDFGAITSQDVQDRHGFEVQADRRKLMARARNYLLYTALKPEHSWVYWRDVDIVDSPTKILEDFIAHDRDILISGFTAMMRIIEISKEDVGGLHLVTTYDYADMDPVDYNSWIESDKAKKLAASLDKDTVIVEGYKQFDTGRTYMARMGDWRDDKDFEIKLDGIGGVNIVVHRSGINFPCYAFENQAETEGFAKMATRAGYEVIGLPNYVVWHIDTEEKGGNK